MMPAKDILAQKTNCAKRYKEQEVQIIKPH
jgi:hypothetical protein